MPSLFLTINASLCSQNIFLIESDDFNVPRIRRCNVMFQGSRGIGKIRIIFGGVAGVRRRVQGGYRGYDGPTLKVIVELHGGIGVWGVVC